MSVFVEQFRRTVGLVAGLRSCSFFSPEDEAVPDLILTSFSSTTSPVRRSRFLVWKSAPSGVQALLCIPLFEVRF